MRHILLVLLLSVSMAFEIGVNNSSACCGVAVGRSFQNASRQSSENDRNAGFAFTLVMAALCAWANSCKENTKNK